LKNSYRIIINDIRRRINLQILYIKGKRYKFVNSMEIWMGYLLFFLMLVCPTEVKYRNIKAVLLILLVNVILIKWFFKPNTKITLSPRIFRGLLFYIIIGLFFMLIGSMKNAPGALRVSTVYVLWPIVYILILSEINNERIIVGIFNVLKSASIFIGLSGLYIFLHYIGIIPSSMYFNIFSMQSVSIWKGSISINFKAINSLFFILPFLIARLLIWSDDRKIRIKRILIWFALILTTVLVLVSNRNTLIVVSILSIFITYFFYTFLSSKKKKIISFYKKFIIVSILLIVIIFTLFYNFNQFSFNSTVNRFLEKFCFDKYEGLYIRKVQYDFLMKGFANNPIFGAGLGNKVDYVRSEKHTWAYELSYVALLYQVGIIGVIIYSYVIIWIYLMGLRIIREDKWLGMYMLPTLVGMSCFLIANATNPYLGTFDHMWVIFLPISIINYYLVNKNENKI